MRLGLRLVARGAGRYRYALRIDLIDEATVATATRVATKVGHAIGMTWTDYGHALRRRSWTHFGSRGAQMTLGDRGGVIQCPGVGPVLEILMSERDLVETRPHAALADLPMAMAMVILRRAVFVQPRDYVSDQSPMSVRVSWSGGPQVVLDDVGDWEPVR